MFYRKRTFSGVRMDVKKAFTLLELVVVVVLVAILSSVAVSKIHTGSKLDEYVYNLLNDVRYTQILALSYDAYDGSSNYNATNNSYYITFDNSNGCYKIYRKLGSISKTTFVKDYMGSNNELNCNSRTKLKGLQISGIIDVGFDYLGRPMDYDKTKNQATLLNTKKEITFTYKGENRTITIEPFTGYIFVKESKV